jgi:hypothetical protein
VHEEEAEETGDAEPEGRGKEGVIDERKKIGETIRMRGADASHTFAEENVAEGAEKDAEENEWKGFELQATGVIVAVNQWSS